MENLTNSSSENDLNSNENQVKVTIVDQHLRELLLQELICIFWAEKALSRDLSKMIQN